MPPTPEQYRSVIDLSVKEVKRAPAILLKLQLLT
jgi:hypothetical protein